MSKPFDPDKVKKINWHYIDYEGYHTDDIDLPLEESITIETVAYSDFLKLKRKYEKLLKEKYER